MPDRGGDIGALLGELIRQTNSLTGGSSPIAINVDSKPYVNMREPGDQIQYRVHHRVYSLADTSKRFNEQRAASKAETNCRRIRSKQGRLWRRRR